VAEIGQILHNNPGGIEAPEYVGVLMSGIRDHIATVYWNVHQISFYDVSPGNIGYSNKWIDKEKESKPPLGIPGMEWNPYYNWGGSPEDEDWDQGEANAPNFSFEGVHVRWYKHFGRSMNVNVQWQPEKWVRWFERAMQTLIAWESESSGYMKSRNKVPYPDPLGVVDIKEDSREYYHAELMKKVATLEAQINSIACICIDVESGKKPKAKKSDWRYCDTLEWVARLGRHAMKTPGFKLFDKG
jgi:hypothetical protein